MSVTHKGIGWELSHSLWIIWSFFALCWVSFLIIGHGAKKRLWTLIGAGYAVLFALWLALTEADKESTTADIGTTIGIFILLGGIVHCFLVRKDYLRRRAIIESESYRVDEMKMELERQRMQREQGITDSVDEAREKLRRKIEELQNTSRQETTQPTTPSQQAAPRQAAPRPAAPAAPAETIDINTCDVTQLASLPGVSMILARKAIGIRNERGGFKSVDEFCEAIQLKPHFVVQVQDMATCSATSTPDEPSAPETPSGRKLDF